jgi:phage gp36-like protein
MPGGWAPTSVLDRVTVSRCCVGPRAILNRFCCAVVEFVQNKSRGLHACRNRRCQRTRLFAQSAAGNAETETSKTESALGKAKRLTSRAESSQARLAFIRASPVVR